MKDTLNARFRAPLKDYYRRRIIVWKDEDSEFADAVAEMTLDNARILTMQKDRMFELRRQVEVDFADENLLIYCPMKFDKPQENWLLDVFLYSEEFRADYWSLLFDELHVENTRPVREYAKTVSAFFKSRERRARLSALRRKYADERELQTGIFGVLCGAKAYGFAEVVRVVLSAEPDEENAALDAMAKFCGENSFWRACEEVYGYVGERDVDLLACHMLATAAMNASDEAAFPGLPFDAAHILQAYAFFVDWMRKDCEGVARVCQRVEERFHIETLLRRMNREELMRIGVFPAVDRLLLEQALNGFAEGRFNLDDVETMLQARRDQAWAAEYAAYYDAVRALIHMRRFELAYRNGFHFTALKEIWTAYAKELYRMDQYYRAFCIAYDRALTLGAMALEDSLKAAADAAERLYKNGYLTELNDTWTRLLTENGKDALTGAARQQDFYKTNVAAADSRVYVIISDALRYDVARSLEEQMTAKLSGNTQCGCILGLLPGVTPVGMAALLPHRQLRLDDDLKIRCDGLSTEAGNRENVLRCECAESVVVDYAEFRQSNKARRSEWMKGKKVVYIYHNTIDRAGESDGNVAQACEDAVEELTQLTRILANELSAANIIVTADHGFLYTRSPLDEYEKTGKEMISGEILEYKRRHAIVRGSGDECAVTISLDELNRPELSAVFPRNCMRFRLQGGSSGYMHGGLSLQEMMVPLLRYQNKKAGQKGYTAIVKTDVMLLGDNRRISNNIFTLNFYQKQPCLGKVQPRTVRMVFEDARGQAISDEHRVVFDMTAPEDSQRTQRVTFRLLSSGYDRNAQYALVLWDADENAEMERVSFQIDIVFENDFGF